MAKNDKVSVLAFEKKLVPSDGYLYGTSWDQRAANEQPLKILEKSVRGTISNRLSKPLMDDPAKLDAEVEKPNPQKIDHCALTTGQDTLKVNFTLKVLSNVQQPSACNNADFNKSYTSAAETYIKEQGFTELAQRYAANLANGRFLWRNRVGAEKTEVVVKSLNEGEDQSWTYDSASFSTRDFNEKHTDLGPLAEKISAALSGATPYLLLEITAYALIGKAQEVYPSEELVLDKGKGKGKKSKILYEVDGVAGMHSQKIGNAIRTIDTWYPDYDEVNTGPIAIEPYGAVTNLGVAYRNPKNKSDFYTLFDEFARGGKLETKEQEHYVMAVLVRGGVFGDRKD